MRLYGGGRLPRSRPHIAGVSSPQPQRDIATSAFDAAASIGQASAVVEFANVENGPEPVRNRALPAPLPAGWRVTVVTEGILHDRAARLEYSIFRAEGFCELSPRHIVEEYEPWRDMTVFHVVLDTDDAVVGVVRSLFGAVSDLPVGRLDHGRCPASDPVIEYASLAVAPAARREGVAESLYRSVWREARRRMACGLVAVVEPWLLALLCDEYGFQFEPFGPLVWYMGGHVLPVAAELAAIEARLAADRPALSAWMWDEGSSA